MKIKLTLINGTHGIGVHEHLGHDTEIVEVPDEHAFAEARDMVGKAWPIVRRQVNRRGEEYNATIFALVVTVELLPGKELR